jgi:hypothetical protein
MNEDNNEEMSNEMKEFMKRLKEAMEQMKNDSGLKDDFFKLLEENRRDGKSIKRGKRLPESLMELKSLRVYGDDRIKSIEPNLVAIEFIIINGINNFLFESNTQNKKNEKLDSLYGELYNYYVHSNQVGTNEYIIDNLDFLIEYYSEDEEYEKCIELMNVKNSFLLLFPEQNLNNENKN